LGQKKNPGRKSDMRGERDRPSHRDKRAKGRKKRWKVQGLFKRKIKGRGKSARDAEDAEAGKDVSGGIRVALERSKRTESSESIDKKNTNALRRIGGSRKARAAERR